MQQAPKINTKNKNFTNFIIFIIVGSIFLIILAILFLTLGAEKVGGKDFFSSFFAFDKNNYNHIIVRDIRVPRLLANVIVGASLATAGAIMQGTTKNPMADSGIMGVNAGATFSIVLMMSFLPNLSRLGRLGFSCFGALLATVLIYAIALIGKKGATPERMILSGMAISTLFGSITTAIVLKKGTMAQMMKYMAGSTANTFWIDINISAPLFIGAMILSIILARNLTVLSLGDDTSKSLGANVNAIKFMSTIVVLVLSAIAVIIIGPVGYVGLMVPYVVKYIVGVDYRYVLPLSSILGACFVTFADLIARLIIRPAEFPIGILISVVGVPFFILVSMLRHNKNL